MHDAARLIPPPALAFLLPCVVSATLSITWTIEGLDFLGFGCEYASFFFFSLSYPGRQGEKSCQMSLV